MTQINWQLTDSSRAAGYVVTATDWNDVAGDLRAFIDQTTSSASDNTPLPIGIDLVNDRVYISDPDTTTPEDGNHANTTLSVVGTSTFDGTTTVTANDFIVDTDTLFVDASADRVAVGTTTPSADFEVYGADAESLVHYTGNSRGGMRAMATNRVAFLSTSSADDLVFGWEDGPAGTFTEQMRLDVGTAAVSMTGDLTVSGGDISIGTTAAGETLNVAGVTTASGAGSNLIVKAGDATGTNQAGAYLALKPGMGTGSSASGDILLQTGPAGSSGATANTPATVLTAMSSGNIYVTNNLGVGTSSPAHTFHVEGTPLARDSGWASSGDLAIWALGSSVGAAERFGVGYKHSTGMIMSVYKSGGSGSFGSNSYDAMTILDTSGNVGIGTTAPTNLLSFGVGLNDTKGLSLDYSGEAKAGMLLNPVSGEVRMGAINSTGDYFVTFYADNAEKMRITAAGLVGIGQSSPAYRCDINEDTADAVPLRVEMSSGGTANQYLARFTRNTGLLTNGIYCDTTNAYFGTPSDERVKRDITAIDPADSLAAITALRPVDFRYIADPDDGEIRNGLIAQEVESVIPAAVHTVIESEPRMETVSVPRVEIVVDDDGNETTVPVLDEDGNQIIDEDTRPVLDDDGKRIIDTTGDSKMLSWDAVNAHMVGAIKELTTRLEALESA